MRPLRNALLCLLVFALVATAAPAQEKIFPYDVTEEVLDNGLRVIVVPMDSNGLVSYWSIVRTGSRDEVEPGKTGFAHFFEHMMFRGTERFPQEVYGDMVTEIGADANAFTSTDVTAYHLTIASEDLGTVMEIEADRFQNLSYSEEVFRTEAGAIYGEYRKNFANPFFLLNEKIAETAFDEHTYGHTTMGYEADIEGMPELYDYAKTFFERYYRPDNVILLVVGDADPQTTIELAKTHYGEWEPGYEAPEVPREPEQTEERKVDVEYPGRTLPIVWLGYKGPAFDPESELQAAGKVFCDLAFGATSEFYQKMVLDEQRIDFVQCTFGDDRDPRLANVITRVKSQDEAEVQAVIDEIDATVAQFKESPPEAQRVSDVQSNIRYGFLMALDTPSAVAENLVRLLAIYGEMSVVEKLYSSLAQVTPEDVQQAADKWFVNDRRTVAVLRGGQ